MPSEAVKTELAIRDETSAVMLTNAQLQMIANTDFVPKGLRGNVPAVLACVARGRAMGIPDMVALNGIVIIEGKATLTAELMVSIVRAHGHSITGRVTAAEAVMRGKRRDNGDEMEASFDSEMAERAGLLNKANWKKHPDDMMYARAVSKLCRRLFADCFAGGTYIPEELEEVTADELIDEQPGGLTEPVEDGATDSLPQPSTLSNSPGSVSPWQQLTQQAKQAGIPKQAVIVALHKHFPDMTWDQLTDENCAALWDVLQAGGQRELSLDA